MEYGILLLIAVALGGGVAGGLLNAWGCHRRLLVLEETLKTLCVAYNDRFKEIERILTRDTKRDAAATRWTGKREKDDAITEKVIQLTNGQPGQSYLNPWDPATWGK